MSFGNIHLYGLNTLDIIQWHTSRRLKKSQYVDLSEFNEISRKLLNKFTDVVDPQGFSSPVIFFLKMTIQQLSEAVHEKIFVNASKQNDIRFTSQQVYGTLIRYSPSQDTEKS